MSVRAKVRVESLALYGDVGTGNVKLVPVTSGPGNESWSKYTPSGAIELGITNPAAFTQFTLGQEFYVDFTPA